MLKQCVVESALSSEIYYQKWGYVTQERVNCDAELLEKWRGQRPVQEFIWMIRTPRQTS